MATKLGMVGEMIPRAVRRVFEQRAEPRIVPDVDHAVLEHRGERHPVRLINVSPSGAMIEFATIPHIGERVRLHVFGHNPSSGFVRWARDGRIGVNFDRPH